jgi:hypothetical protein
MDDMGTPGPNHPAHRGLKDRARDKSRVIDLDTFRKTRVVTEPESDDFKKHADEAMELGNPQ